MAAGFALDMWAGQRRPRRGNHDGAGALPRAKGHKPVHTELTVAGLRPVQACDKFDRGFPIKNFDAEFVVLAKVL